MYFTTNSARNKKIYFKTNEATRRIKQKFISQFNLSQTINIENKKDNSKRVINSINSCITIDEDNNDDFLFSFRQRFDDIFKKLEGHEKIFEELKKKNKNKKPSNDLVNSTIIYSKKPNIVKKRVIRHKRIDVNKIIEIQKIFKGHIIRNVHLDIDRLKLRQCLIELFCLLLLGHWCHSQIRYNFYLMKEYYITARLYAGEELSFIDRISLKLPNCFYSKAKINDLRSNQLGEYLKFD